MEIDLVHVLIGIIAIIICALPFVMMNRNEKKRQQKFLDSLANIAHQNNCKIGNHEVFGKFAIGFDESNNHLLFCRQSKEKMKEHFLKLSEIKSCKVVKIRKTVNETDIIDKLELSLLPVDKNKAEVNLAFYKSSVSAQLYDELQSIDKWSKLINNQLKIIK